MSTKVIVISGSSGAGKSSLVNALQEELLPSIWLRFSFDSIVYSLPGSVLDQCNNYNNWSGIDSQALYDGSTSCLKSLVFAGNKVIFDVVLTDDKQVESLIETLVNVEVRSFHLEASWDEIERRTVARGDRTIEEAQRSFETSRALDDNSVLLDSTKRSAQDLAKEVLRVLK